MGAEHESEGFAEEAIIGVLKEAEAGAKTKELCRRLINILTAAKSFEVAHPEVILHFLSRTTPEQLEDLRFELIDISFCFSESSDRKVSSKEIWTDRAHIVLRHDHPLAVGDRIRISDLPETRFGVLAHNRQMPDITQRLNACVASAIPQAQIEIVDSCSVLLSMICLGRFVGVGVSG